MNQKYLKRLSVLLLVIVIGFFCYNWHEIFQVYDKINIYWALSGFGCYVINYFFRGFRLRILTGSKIFFITEALHFSMLHGFFSYLLPFRTGDASLPALLKTTGKIDLKNSLGILAKTRILDLTMVGFYSLLGSFFGARMISQVVQSLWFFAGLLLSFSWFFFQKIGRISDYLLKHKFKYKFDISTLLRFSYKDFFITFFIWMSVYASQYCMIRAIGLDLKIFEVIFLSAIQFPLQMLPVQGLANTGNHEGGWVSALILMGFSAQESLKYAIVSHSVLIIYVALLGLLALITGNSRIVSFFKRRNYV